MSNVQRIILIAIVFAFTLSFISPAFPLFGNKKTEAEKKKEIQQEKADIQKMAKETLARLYKLQPSAKESILKSAGYGVFSNFGMKIFVAGSGKGKGIVFDNKSRKQTFMKMIELQAGIGLGIKTCTQIDLPCRPLAE